MKVIETSCLHCTSITNVLTERHFPIPSISLNGAREFVQSHQNAITFQKSMFTETIVGGWQSTDQTAAEMQLKVFSRVWQMVGKVR